MGKLARKLLDKQASKQTSKKLTNAIFTVGSLQKQHHRSSRLFGAVHVDMEISPKGHGIDSMTLLSNLT